MNNIMTKIINIKIKFKIMNLRYNQNKIKFNLTN